MPKLTHTGTKPPPQDDDSASNSIRGPVQGGSGAHRRSLPGVTSSSMSPIRDNSPPAATSRSGRWAHFAAFRTVLNQATSSFGPLKATVGELTDYLGNFDRFLSGKKEYEVLHDQLEVIFETLQRHHGEGVPPAMSSAVETLCEDIKQELRSVEGKLNRGRLKRFNEAADDVDEVLRCYDRIRGHLQRISLNVDMSVWRIVDEFITDNRLRQMSPSLSACYNSAKAIELKRGSCTEGTRVDVLTRMINWVNNSRPFSVYWVSGMAGTGKTTIAYSFCRTLDDKRHLAASFFCSRLLPECRDVNLIIPSIAYQLARTSYPFRFELSSVLEKDPDVYTRLPSLQFDALIVQPLLKVKDTLPDNLVVVIDALDECENKENARQMLELLLTSSLDLPLKFVVSSRPEPEIRDGMSKQGDPIESRVVLHELDSQIVQADIEVYLRAELGRMQPTEDQISALVRRAGILFIYAATVVRYIGYNNFRRNPHSRLANVLNASSTSKNKYKELDELYTTILQEALSDPGLDDSDIEDMRQVLYTVTCSQEPMTIDVLSRLLGMNDPERVRAALSPLWSILHTSEASELINTLHASFPEYIFDPSRSNRYHCNLETHSQFIAQRCFDIFRDLRPQFNICGLESSFVADQEVPGMDARIRDVISAELFYAARYWVLHFCSGSSGTGSSNITHQLEEFLSVRLLLWMEVMNLKGCSGSMPGMIRLLEKWNGDLPVKLRELIYDAWRFTTTFASAAIANSTPHLYTSMLPFWPMASPIGRAYTRRKQGTIITDGTAIAQQQHALLATWRPPQMLTSCSPAFSPDGTQIAISSVDEILFLSTSTGQISLSPLKGPTLVSSLQFSPDGARIATGLFDNTICVWTIKSREIVAGPMEGHTSQIFLVAFSPDGARIVSAALDANIFVWDAWSGEQLWGLRRGHGGGIGSVKYSPDGRFIISSEGRSGIAVWNAQDGRLFKTISASFRSTDISPDATLVAPGPNGDGLYIWGIESGQAILGPLQATNSLQNYGIRSFSFSPDGSHLASGSGDGTIRIWDTHSGDLVLGPLEGHTSYVHSVSFSPDGAYILSSYGDRTICLWDARRMQQLSNALPGHTGSVTSVDFSPDGRYIISAAKDQALCIWDAQGGAMIPRLLDHKQYELVSLSVGGTRIISMSGNGVVVLDFQTGDIVLGPLEGTQAVYNAVFSSDGAYIVCTLLESIVRVLAADTGQTLMVIHPPPIILQQDWIISAAFSPDSTRIAMGSSRGGMSVYETSSGRLLWYCAGHYVDGGTIKFSPNGTHILFRSLHQILLRNAQTGELMMEPPLAGSVITSLEFSPDGLFIVSGETDHSICVWNTQTGRPVLGPIKWHTSGVGCAKFSPEGTRVVSGSQDGTIRVTDVQVKLDYVGLQTLPTQAETYSRSRLYVQIPTSLSPTGRDWELKTDGWIVDEQGRLLAWVPSELHAALMWPRTKLLISRKGWLRLDFSDARLGDSWAECYRPEL